MANTTKTHGEEIALLGKMLSPSLPLDTDGLPGLVDAPAVYDLILRDLQEDEVLADGPSGVKSKQDGVLKREHRPG